MDRGLEHLSSRADATENTAAIRAAAREQVHEEPVAPGLIPAAASTRA